MFDKRVAAALAAHERVDRKRHRQNVARLAALERQLAKLNGQMAVVLVILAALLSVALYRMA